MKKHRISWPPRRERQAPVLPAAGAAERELSGPAAEAAS